MQIYIYIYIYILIKYNTHTHTYTRIHTHIYIYTFIYINYVMSYDNIVMEDIHWHALYITGHSYMKVYSIYIYTVYFIIMQYIYIYIYIYIYYFIIYKFNILQDE